MIPKNKLMFWLTNNLNVLLEGRHGVGKSSVIFQALEELGIKYKYFSAATMDPWVDFIGAPRPMEDAKGPYLDLVLPKSFRDDDVELIIMDEFNRAPAKVRNACMELLQFKSINGRKFPNLRMLWAAVNPHDDEGEYDTDGMDPAQLDRFHIQYKVPFDVNAKYFAEKFGAVAAQVAIDWWRSIPDDIRKRDVSPRRLDYAMEIFMLASSSDRGADLHDVLTQSVNVSDLEQKLSDSNCVGIVAQIDKAYGSRNENDAKRLVNNPAFWNAALTHVNQHSNLISFYAPLVGKERIIAMLHRGEHTAVINYVLNNPDQFSYLEDVYRNGSDRTRELMRAHADTDNGIPLAHVLAEVDGINEPKPSEIDDDEPSYVGDPKVIQPVNLGEEIKQAQAAASAGAELDDEPEQYHDSNLAAEVEQQVQDGLSDEASEVSEELDELDELEASEEELAALEAAMNATADAHRVEVTMIDDDADSLEELEELEEADELRAMEESDEMEDLDDTGASDFDDFEDWEDAGTGELGESADDEPGEAVDGDVDLEDLSDVDPDAVYDIYYSDNGDPADLEKTLRKVEASKSGSAATFKTSSVTKLYKVLERQLPETFTSEEQAERTLVILDSMLAKGSVSDMPLLLWMANHCIENSGDLDVNIDRLTEFAESEAGREQGMFAL